MSLIKCIECGKEFSDKAIACPKCACPTEYIMSYTKKEKIKREKNNKEKNNKKEKIYDNKTENKGVFIFKIKNIDTKVTKKLLEEYIDENNFVKKTNIFNSDLDIAVPNPIGIEENSYINNNSFFKYKMSYCSLYIEAYTLPNNTLSSYSMKVNGVHYNLQNCLYPIDPYLSSLNSLINNIIKNNPNSIKPEPNENIFENEEKSRNILVEKMSKISEKARTESNQKKIEQQKKDEIIFWVLLFAGVIIIIVLLYVFT